MSKFKKYNSNYILTDDKDVIGNERFDSKIQAILFSSDLARIITKNVLPLKMIIISDFEIKDITKLKLLDEENVFIIGNCDHHTLFITVVKDATNLKSKVELNLLLKINLLTLFPNSTFYFKNVLIS